MRLFVGVALAPEVRTAADLVGQEMRRHIGSQMRASWIPPDKMHLTVRFIGHVDDARVPAVLDAVAPPLEIPPFDIDLDRCGAFPRSGPPRVFWIGLSAGLPELEAMHHEFNRRLLPLGFAPEERTFTAHLTLARIKEAPRDAARTARAILATLPVPRVHSRVNHATVFQSVLSPRGSTYRGLLEIPCAL